MGNHLKVLIFMNKLNLKQLYEDSGYLLVPEALNLHVCQQIQQHALELIETWEPHDFVAFNSESTAHHDHDYFLKSADGVHFFFEEGVVDEQGNLNRPRHLAINKIGHALHRKHSFFKNFCDHPSIHTISEALGLDPIWICSMLVFKQPFVGGEVLPHQDASYLYTSPQSLTSFWFALEDATEDNGCLWVLPGGHKQSLKYRSFLNDKQFEEEIYDPTPWDLKDFIPVPVPQGSLIVFDGLLPHYSGPNQSSKSRHAYILQGFYRGSAYAEDNWIPPPHISNTARG